MVRNMKIERSFFLGGDDVLVYSDDVGNAIYRNSTGLTAVAFQGKGQRPLWSYRFRNEAHRADYILNQTKEWEKLAELKTRRAAEKAEKKASFVNPFAVGDILTYSWGWDQTNVDAFQVVAVTKGTVSLRPIGCTQTKANSFMSAFVKPVKDAFTSEEITTHRVTLDGTVKMSYGYARKWDGRELYNSWYA